MSQEQVFMRESDQDKPADNGSRKESTEEGGEVSKRPTTRRKRNPSRRFAESMAEMEKDKKEKEQDKKRVKRKYKPRTPKSAETSINSSTNRKSASAASSLDEEDDGLDHMICCICKSSVDYSDRGVFFPPLQRASGSQKCDASECVSQDERPNQEKQGSSAVVQPQVHIDSNDKSQVDVSMPTLPASLYDSQNALVLCDGPDCHRSYHQRCHFVPMFTLPRGDWLCLLCHSSRQPGFHKKKGHDSSVIPNFPKRQLELLYAETRNHFLINKGKEPMTEKSGSATDRVPSSIQVSLASAQSESPANQRSEATENDEDSDVSISQLVATKTSNENDDAKNRKEKESATKLLSKWELETGDLKATSLHTEIFRRMKASLQQSMGNIRQAQDSIRAYTETDRARKAVVTVYRETGRLPQQLVQSVHRMATCKLRIREQLMSMKKYIRGYSEVDELLKWVNTIEKEGALSPSTEDGEVLEKSAASAISRAVDPLAVRKELFPLGLAGSRILPKFDSTSLNASGEGHTSGSQGEEPVPCDTKKRSHDLVGSTISLAKDEDDDMISMDEIRCVSCLGSHCSDENDILLCDGEGCFRAFHMKCVHPRVTQEVLDSDPDGDWFCPYCTALATHLHQVQVEYMGDDWAEEWARKKKQREREYALRRQKSCGDAENGGDEDHDSSDVESWQDPQEVFPEGEFQLSVAEKCRKGKHDDDVDTLLSGLLGIDVGNDQNGSQGVNEDSEDEGSEDENFDLQEFEKMVDNNGNEGSDSEGDVSLQDMSSVESLHANEVDALSGVSSDDEDAESESSVRQIRTRSKRNANETAPDGPNDIGALHKSNIVHGKRRRNKVDYRRLNDAMFGTIPSHELDDDEVFSDNGSTEAPPSLSPKANRRKQPSSSKEDNSDSDNESASPPRARPPSRKKKTVAQIKKARKSDKGESPGSDSSTLPTHKANGAVSETQITPRAKGGTSKKKSKAKGGTTEKLTTKPKKSPSGRVKRSSAKQHKSTRVNEDTSSKKKSKIVHNERERKRRKHS